MDKPNDANDNKLSNSNLYLTIIPSTSTFLTLSIPVLVNYHQSISH